MSRAKLAIKVVAQCNAQILQRKRGDLHLIVFSVLGITTCSLERALER